MEVKTNPNMTNSINKKIPGDLPTIPRKEGQGYVEDLKKLQKFELEDLLERQNNLLSRK